MSWKVAAMWQSSTNYKESEYDGSDRLIDAKS